MNIEEKLEQLAHQQYPRQVDVTDRVMAHVAQHPYLRPVHRTGVWRRISVVAAAAVAALLVVNVASVYTRSYDIDGMAGTIAQVNDYASWNSVEQLAAGPYDYLYEE